MNPFLATNTSKTAVCLLSCLCLPLATAQDNQNEDNSEETIERIVVSADLLLRDLSELPASALVLDNEAIEAKQARHLQDLVSLAPNLNFSSGASRGRFIQIRGIGERSQFAEPINPSIGLLLDDIDISGIGALATVYDVSQVEILSGPQSVASGVNSIGGIVKLVSNAPTPAQYASINASYAQYNETVLAGTYSNAINDNLSARFSLQQTKSDSFVENAFLQRDDTNGIDELSIKALFNYKIDERQALDVNIYHFDINNGYDAFSLDNNNVTVSDMPGEDTVDALAASVKYTHQFDAYDFQATLFYVDADTTYGYDEDWTFDGFHPDGYSSIDNYDRQINRSGLDVKLAGQQDSQNENNFLVGFNYTTTDEDLQRQNTFIESDYISQYQPTSLSLFGQYEWALNDIVNVTGAMRIEDFSSDFVDNDVETSLDDTLVAASLALDYSIGNALLYASLSRGYKAAGYNIDSRLPSSNRAYDAESNYSYELGVKGSAYEGLANINLSFFYMTRKDAQVSDSIVLDIDGSDASSFVDGIGNADTGINKGLEITTTFDVSDNWYLQANFGYLDATFGNYTKLDGSFVPKQDQAHAPRRTAYFASTWQISESLSWFVDLEYKDDFRLGITHDQRSDSTSVVNSEIKWQSNSKHLYNVRLWVKNLFDEAIITRGFGSFPNDPRDGYSTLGPYFQFGQSRQIGVSFQYEWE